MEVIGYISIIISVICLVAIASRKDIPMPLFGGIFTPELNDNIDSTDKKLAFASLVFFLTGILLLLFLQ